MLCWEFFFCIVIASADADSRIRTHQHKTLLVVKRNGAKFNANALVNVWIAFKWILMLTFVCSMQCELGLWNCHTFMRRRRKKETWSNRFVCWWKSTFRTRKKIWKINLVMHWFWPICKSGLVNESVWILFIAKQHDSEMHFNQSFMLAYPLLWFFCISHVSVLFVCSFFLISLFFLNTKIIYSLERNSWTNFLFFYPFFVIKKMRDDNKILNIKLFN